MIGMIEQLKRKLRLIVGKAIVKAVSAAEGDYGLTIDIEMGGGEKHSRVPLLQQYGFSARPNKESEAIVLFIGGSRDNGIAIATQGDASKLPAIEDGEVALFSEFGQTIILKKDGSIVAAPKSGKPYRIESDVEITGDLVALCDSTKITMSKHIHQTGVGASSSPQLGV